MKRNAYLLVILLMVLLTPLSMQAFGTSPRNISLTEKPTIAGCDGVTVVAGSGNIAISGLGSYSDIQIFTPNFASQVFQQTINSPSITVPISAAGDYIVKVWSNPNPDAFCENNFYVTVGGGSVLTLNGCNNASARAAAGATSAIVNYTTPTATTTCAAGGATVTRTSGGASGTAFPVGTSQVCFSATDACGNTKTCCITITVTATTGCSNVTSGGIISKSCNNGVITLSGTTPIGGSGNLEYQWLSAIGACPTNITQAIAGATNATLVVNGSSVTATTYYVRCSRRAGCSDATSWIPGVSNCISIVAGECPTGGGGNICTSPAANIVGGAGSISITGITTGCSMIQVFNSNWSHVYNQQVSGTTATIPNLPAGSYIVKVTVLGVGCTWPAVCDVQVTVTVGGGIDSCATDAIPPTFTNCPANISLTTTGTCAYASWTAPTAIDNCGTPSVTQLLGGANGSCFPIGTTLVKYMATDAKGNTAICVFNVVVTRIVIDPCATDAIAPTFTNCLANIVKTPTSAGSCWTVHWMVPTAIDNCGTPTIAQTAGPINGSCLAPGTYTVTYKATDAKGNVATCSFTILVNGYLNCNNVTGNTISKSCVNNILSLIGSNLVGYEYVWLRGTTGCPNQTSQAIAGATGQHYTLPSRVTSTTYFVRCARPIGCTTWGTINESNCITVYASDCAPVCSVNFSTIKCYKIVNKRSGKVLDAYGSCNNNSKITQYSYYGGTNQQWRLTALGNGCYKLAARNCGKVLACYDTYEGANTCQHDYDPWGAKDWKIECATGQYYRIKHRLSGKVLDIEGDSYNDGAAAEIRTHDGTDSQLWEIVEVACNTSSQHLASNDVLDINAAAELSRTRLEWLNNTGYKNDFFTLEKMNNLGDFETLDIVNNKYSSEINEHYTAYDNAPNEGDNTYRIKVTYVDGATKISDIKTINYKGLTGLRLFPNPAIDVLSLDLTTYKGQAVSVYLYNQFGQQVLTHQVEKVNGETVNLDVSQQQAGNYLIRVTSKNRKDVARQVHIAK